MDTFSIAKSYILNKNFLLRNGQKHAKVCERLGRENIDLVQLLESQSQSPLEERFKGKPDDAKKVTDQLESFLIAIEFYLNLMQAKAPEGDRSLFCDICQVRCSCFDNMKEHLASKRHQVLTTQIFYIGIQI